jgi:uncharacterized DUF497 family protein
MNFEWDSSKAAKNETKHKVSFTEAIAVFQDSLSMTYPDVDHSEEEDRFLIIGATKSGKVLVVSHVFREDTIRIISARSATARERAFYEQQSQH